MGPSYELREWLGVYYIVQRDHSTDWQDKANQISNEQYLELEKLNNAHEREMENLMLTMIK